MSENFYDFTSAETQKGEGFFDEVSIKVSEGKPSKSVPQCDAECLQQTMNVKVPRYYELEGYHIPLSI